MKNSEKDSLVGSVYNIIKNRKARVTAKHLEKGVGSMYKVHYALTRLIREQKGTSSRGRILQPNVIAIIKIIEKIPNSFTRLGNKFKRIFFMQPLPP